MFDSHFFFTIYKLKSIYNGFHKIVMYEFKSILQEAIFNEK